MRIHSLTTCECECVTMYHGGDFGTLRVLHFLGLILWENGLVGLGRHART